MKKFERILWIVVGLAVLMMVTHVPLGSFLLILAMNTLSIVYFFLAWLVFPTPTRRDGSIPLSLGVGLVLSVAVIGILFKIQLWPLSTFFLVVSLVGLVLMTGGVLAFRPHRPNLFAYSRGLLVRLITVTIVCAALYLLPGGALTAFYYRDNPVIAPLMIQRNTTTDPAERERLTILIDSIEQGPPDAGGQRWK